MNVISKIGFIAIPEGILHWIALRDGQNNLPAPNSPPDFLHPAEIEHWKTLKVDKRRREWTLGRRAAKELITELVRERTAHELHPAEIEIMPHGDGWPIVSLPTQAEFPALTLSVSHSQDMAFCTVVEGAHRLLGADIESVEPRLSAFAEEYFTPLENRFLVAAPVGQHTVLVNAIWSGKEAALKAIRRGLAEDTRLVSCLPHPLMNSEAEWLPMRVEWTDERAAQSMPTLRGYWRRDGDFVMTLAFSAIQEPS